MNKKKIINISFLVLVFALVLVFTGCKPVNMINKDYVYDMDGYIRGNMSYKEVPVNVVNVDWIVGEVQVFKSDNDKEFIIQEDVEMNIEDKYRVHHKLTDGILDVKFVESMANLSYHFNLKILRLYIPLTIEKVVINTVNAEIKVMDASFNNLEINTVDGDISVRNIKCNNLSVDSTSGEIIIFNNSIKNNKIKVVSSNVGLNLKEIPESLEFNSVSGNLKMYVLETDKFAIDVDSTSGKLKSNLEYVKNKNNYIFNEGTILYKFYSVSGDLSILKK